MFKKAICVLCLFLGVFLFQNCASGSEDSQDNSVKINGTEVDILALLSITALRNVFWEGLGIVEDCQYAPLSGTTIASCVLLQDAQQTIIKSVNPNLRIGLNYTSGAAEGQIFLTMPHLDLTGHVYTINVSGSTTPSSTEGKATVVLTQTGLSQQSGDSSYTIQLTNFRADDLTDSLSGSFTLVLTQSGVSDQATLVYTFNLPKVL